MPEVGSAVRRTTTGTLVSAGPGFLRGVQLNGGSDAATAIVRDGGASGTIIGSVKAAAGATVAVSYPCLVPFVTDLHLTVTGTSPEVFAFV
jgi:hypothetical protein